MRRKKEPLERLEERVRPPGRPFEAGLEDRRDAVERSLGAALPQDLYRLSLRYGSGSFGTEGNPTLLTLFNPFSRHYRERVQSWTETYRRYREAEGGRALPYSVHPASPGLLPCGSGERRMLFWLVDGGSPGHWPLVVWDPDDRFHRLQLPLTDFLVRLFGGKLDCYGGDLAAAWFRANRGSFVFRPDRPRKGGRSRPQASGGRPR